MSNKRLTSDHLISSHIAHPPSSTKVSKVEVKVKSPDPYPRNQLASYYYEIRGLTW
jgi:hypothetical protein